jgi:hypothetical protein
VGGEKMMLRHTHTTRVSRCIALLAVLGLAGCAGWDDPFEREGTWRPEHNNDANLGVMVADPGQFVEGTGDEQSPGVLSAAAVHRLLTDKVKPLTIPDLTDISNGSPGASPGTGASTGTQ